MEAKSIWNDPSEYDRYATNIQERNADILIGLISKHILRKDSVVDLGCGTGALIERLLKDFQFNKYVGIDISNDMLSQANRRLNSKLNCIELIQGDYMTTDIKEKFSAVISNAAFHWFDDDLSKSFKRASEMISDGGLIAIATAGLCKEVNLFDEKIMEALPNSRENPFNRRRITSERLKEIGKSESLDVIDTFTLLRTLKMKTTSYAYWLCASGFHQTGENKKGNISVIEKLLKSFGENITLQHCTTYGIFKRSKFE